MDLDRIIHNLQTALNVMTEAVNPDGMGYAYASGYARSCITQAIDDLTAYAEENEATSYRVTDIQFDFEDDDFELPVNQQQDLIQDCKKSVWTVDCEDALVDAITDHYGFCVQSIEYERLDVPPAELSTIAPFFP